MHPSQVVDKGALFVPFGWDSLEKIQLDFDTQRACNDASAPFNQVIKKPSALDRVRGSRECRAETRAPNC